MKCPRCGAEMTIDSHRKIPLNMCYECGYIEGRSLEGSPESVNNYNHLKELSLVEMAAYLSKSLKKHGVDLPAERFVDWLMDVAE